MTLQELKQLKLEGLGSSVKKAVGAAVPVVATYAGMVGIDRLIRELIMMANKQYRHCVNKALDKHTAKMVKMKGFPYREIKHAEAQYDIEVEKCKHAYKMKILAIKEKKAKLKAEMVKRKKQIK